MSRRKSPSTRLDILPPAQVAALVRRYQRNGDPRAADRLVRGHYRLIAKIAREYTWSGQDVRDLIQAGSLGFLRALQKYDPDRGFKLGSYAVYWMRAFMMRQIMDNWRLVRIGKTQRERRFFHNTQTGELSQADLLLRRHVHVPEISLDAPISPRSDPSATETRLDLLRGPDDARPDLQVEDEELRQRVRGIVARFAEGLGARDLWLFQQRWSGNDQPTLASLALKLGVGRERARQLERRILDRLAGVLEAEIGDLPEVNRAA